MTNTAKSDKNLFVTDKPTDSLYAIIANLKAADSLVQDPYWKPKKLSSLNDVFPSEPPPMVTQYEAFQKYISGLWRMVKPADFKISSLLDYQEIRSKWDAFAKRKPVSDFLLQRAAYLFVVKAHKKTAVNWECPETFMIRVRSKNSKALWNAMIGELKFVYESVGLGWDGTNLSNETTYQAELEHAKLYNEKPREELFPSYCWQNEQFRNYCQLREQHTNKMPKQETTVQNESVLFLERIRAKPANVTMQEWRNVLDNVWTKFTKKPEEFHRLVDGLNEEQKHELHNLIPFEQQKQLGIVTDWKTEKAKADKKYIELVGG